MEIHTSVGEIIDILKKFKDADPADSHHAPEWEERQKSRVDGLRSRLLLWRSSPHSMSEDLENIYMLLFQFVGHAFHIQVQCPLSVWETVWGKVGAGQQGRMQKQRHEHVHEIAGKRTFSQRRS